MSYKAIIFDMDGVIIDSKQEVEQFWIEKLQKYGVKPEESPEELELKYHGRPARLIIDDLFGDLPESVRQKLAEECAAYDVSKEEYDYIPGVKNLLKTCLDLNLNTGLVTSALQNKVDVMLRSLGFESPFHTVVTAERVQNGKPDPECYLLAAKELGVEAGKCLVFEDSRSGIEAASNAGASVIGINQPRISDVLQNSGAILVAPDFNNAKIEYENHEITLFPDIDQSNLNFVISRL